MSSHSIAENLIRLQEAKEDIADAIVEMGGTASSTDGLEDMPDAIRTIEANPTLITKSITANGTYDASDDSADGYSEVTVNVQASSDVNTGTAEYISNSNYYTRGTTTGVGLFSGSILIIDQNVYYARPSGVYGTYNFTGTLFTLSGIILPKNKTANIVDCTRSNNSDIFTLVFDYTNNTVQVKYNYTLTARGNASEQSISALVYVYWT